MTALLVLAALRPEIALLRVPAAAQLVRTGMGRRSEQAVPLVTGSGAGAVAVVGFCGALAPGMRPGDVVVASEVRSHDGTVVACPSAPLLVAALRRTGLRVHLGPLVTSPSLVTGAARARLAATGAVAVDMETGPLLAAAQGRPVAAVRVVVDTPDVELTSLRLVAGLLPAARALRSIGEPLAAWARATGPRWLVLASPRAFCAGVERAVTTVDRALERYGTPVFVRRQIVHDAHVVAELEQRGAVFVDELDAVPDGAVVVFSAHGVAPAVRAAAAARPLRVLDATCPLVAKVHAEVRRFAARGDTVVLVGHRGHDEAEATVGEAPDQVVVVESPAEAAAVVVPPGGRVSQVVQTTLAADDVAPVERVLRSRFPDLDSPRSDDICYATTNRQLAVQEVAREVDLLLVVGSANSSNSQRLVEVAARAGCAARLVEDATHVDPTWLADVRRIGLTAGASAPPGLVDAVQDALAGLGPVQLVTRTVAHENVQFGLPPEVT